MTQKNSEIISKIEMNNPSLFSAHLPNMTADQKSSLVSALKKNTTL